MAGQNSVSAYLPHSVMAALLGVVGGVQVATLGGNVTLDVAYPTICKLDPGGSHRDITLDAEPTSTGMFRVLINAADAAENLVAKSDAPATIATINQNELGVFYCDGTDWILLFVLTIALS